MLIETAIRFMSTGWITWIIKLCDWTLIDWANTLKRSEAFKISFQQFLYWIKVFSLWISLKSLDDDLALTTDYKQIFVHWNGRFFSRIEIKTNLISASNGLMNGDPRMVCVFTIWSSNRFWISSIDDKICVPVSRYGITLNCI